MIIITIFITILIVTNNLGKIAIILRCSKKYVDDLIVDNVGNINGGGSPFFKENGNYQATNAINMAFKKLLNLFIPSEPYEAATKEYVDERPHIIVVHTHYCGNLRKDEYQFTFGGNRGSKLDTGLLVPQSGGIKKIQTKISHEGKNSSRSILSTFKNAEVLLSRTM